MVAYRAARLDDCLVITRQYDTAAAVALYARASFRVGRIDDVLTATSSVDDAALDHAGAAEILALRGVAFALTGRVEEAEAALTAARVRAYVSSSPPIEAECEYLTGLSAWVQNDYKAAKEYAEKALLVGLNVPQWYGDHVSSAVVSVENVHARALDMLGNVAALNEDYREQARYLTQAVELLERCTVGDIYAEAVILFSLSALVRDLDLPSVAAFLRERVDAIAWTQDLASFEFGIRRNLGWCEALHGNHVGALRAFRESADVAPSVLGRIAAIVDRSHLSREISEKTTAAEELDYALRLSERVNWSSIRGEEIFTLYELAQNVAARDAGRARQLFEKYVAVRRNLSPLLFGQRNRRLRASECFANATISKAEGDRQRATSLFDEAFVIWASIGYDWQAASAAAELAELTGEERYLAFAAAETEKRPNSWLARRLKALASRELCLN